MHSSNTHYPQAKPDPIKHKCAAVHDIPGVAGVGLTGVEGSSFTPTAGEVCAIAPTQTACYRHHLLLHLQCG